MGKVPGPTRGWLGVVDDERDVPVSTMGRL